MPKPKGEYMLPSPEEIEFALKFLSKLDKYDYDTDYFRQSIKTTLTVLSALKSGELVPSMSGKYHKVDEFYKE